MAKRRYIMRIELTGPAKQKLKTMSDKLGMTQVAMMSRVVEFLANQNDMMQGAVLGIYPEAIEADVAKLILEKMGKK